MNNQSKNANMIELMIAREKAIRSIEQRHEFLDNANIEDIKAMHNKRKSDISTMISSFALALEEM